MDFATVDRDNTRALLCINKNSIQSNYPLLKACKTYLEQNTLMNPDDETLRSKPLSKVTMTNEVPRQIYSNRYYDMCSQSIVLNSIVSDNAGESGSSRPSYTCIKNANITLTSSCHRLVDCNNSYVFFERCSITLIELWSLADIYQCKIYFTNCSMNIKGGACLSYAGSLQVVNTTILVEEPTSYIFHPTMPSSTYIYCTSIMYNNQTRGTTLVSSSGPQTTLDMLSCVIRPDIMGYKVIDSQYDNISCINNDFASTTARLGGSYRHGICEMNIQDSINSEMPSGSLSKGEAIQFGMSHTNEEDIHAIQITSC